MAKSYFLGCPTPNGFETHFGDDIKSGEFFTYIIKGGPGTGKSTLMKRIAAELSDLDEPELYYCSSDPDSLDGVVFRGLRVIFVDGTSPHVFEPTYPGARERLLDLGQFWDGGTLRKNSAEIVRFSNDNQKLHLRAKRCLGAICSLGADIMTLGDGALLAQKLDAYAARLAQKLFPKTGRSAGKISLRQITTITPKGVITQDSALEGAQRLVITDPCFSVTDTLLKNLSVRALAAGHDVIASKNVFLGGCVYEHILLPELGIAIVSRDTADADGSAKINGLRFYDRSLLHARRHKINFDSGIRKELVAETAKTLAEAKAVHDELEACYIEAMDFAAIEKLSTRIVEEIRSR